MEASNGKHICANASAEQVGKHEEDISATSTVDKVVEYFYYFCLKYFKF
jgi:hypothetical protein